MTLRPFPPVDLVGVEGALAVDHFEPAVSLAAWARETFIDPSGPLMNEEHAHLNYGTIGFLWTNCANTRQGRRIVGQAEIMPPQGAMGKWAKARAMQQIEGWFGLIPDFLITIDALYWAEADDASACALIEHELLHCAQERDAFGAPKFTKEGGPKFGMRGHDVEEFVSVVRRYGMEAANVTALVEAARKGPEIAAASVAHACGTCLARAA